MWSLCFLLVTYSSHFQFNPKPTVSSDLAAPYGYFILLRLSVYTDLPQSNPNLIMSIRLGGSMYRSC